MDGQNGHTFTDPKTGVETEGTALAQRAARVAHHCVLLVVALSMVGVLRVVEWWLTSHWSAEWCFAGVAFALLALVTLAVFSMRPSVLASHWAYTAIARWQHRRRKAREQQ